ncbi:MAG: L,D-transpeptidase family protein [Alphaproteobacteria bacterium]|nr:L,D-transpeptidase family protein [Alphaproteobacteria bacterium]
MRFLRAAALAATLLFPAVASADVAAMVPGALAQAGRPGDGGGAATRAAIVEAYRARRNRPLWADGTRATALRAALRNAASDGLDARRYLAAVDRHWDGRSDAARAMLDVALTGALAAYAHDLWYGRPEAKVVDESLTKRHERLELARFLAAAADADAARLARLIDALRPPHPQYAKLRAALARLDAAGAAGEAAIAEGPILRPGMRDVRVAGVRERIEAEGEWSEAEEVAFAAPSYSEGGDWARYDEGLTRAVKRFQRRLALLDDGLVGGRTLWALNMDDRERRRLVVENMEKLRWLPRRLEADHIVVNMAGFDLTVVKGGKTYTTMKVVVGRPFRQTPIMRSDITDLVLNPYWNAPEKLAREDLFPKLRTHPGYFAEKGYRVLAGWSQSAPEVPLSLVDPVRLTSPMGPIRVRQEPGPKNALGRIKFNMQNAHAIYLHDTPDRHLFDRSARSFSSGCIRLEQPVQLAELLLADQPGWPPERLAAAIETGETRTVPLRKRWPVYLVYQTAWVDERGELVVRDDVYGLRAGTADRAPQKEG